jgi:uncharacterized RDD family membrane protein YckC
VDGIVIGEGVLLDARSVSVLTRVLAAAIDLVVLLVGGLALLLLVAALPLPDSDAAGAVLGIVVLAGVTVVLPTTVDTLSRGRSLGKLAVGIRIVRDDGGPIVFRQALVRALVGLVELWLTAGSIAVICSMVHPQGKRVGDILAGTYAVRVRGVPRDAVVVVMPPRLAWWARSADVARLPDGLALSVRQFLGRARQLHPGSRVELGTSLTREVERYVRPPPPAGTHPEEFLAAVIAERRDRELRRLHREDQVEAAEAALVQRLPHGIADPVD